MHAAILIGLAVVLGLALFFVLALAVIALTYREDPRLKAQITEEAAAVVEEVLNGTYHLRSQESPNT